MDPAGIPALCDAIRHLYNVEPKHYATVPVHERAPSGETVWQGDVEEFEITGHHAARRAYAWSEATTGTKRRFFVVLGLGPVVNASTAVRASILADVGAKPQSK